MHIIDYFEKLQQCFIANARPENMAAMEAYMLNQFHFLGIKAPHRRALMKEVGLPKWSAGDVLQLARALWTLPYREYHYLAIDQLARHVKVLRVEHIAVMLKLAQEHSWWDSVDGLAGVIGDVLLREKQANVSPRDVMDPAVEHASLWVRRIAMTHQLGWRLQTDVQCLSDYALRLADEKDFFIRKAIGWSMRDYGRWNPAFVRGFFAEHAPRFSNLTQREALKHLT